MLIARPHSSGHCISLVGKILEFCFAVGKEIFFDNNKLLYWVKTLDTKTLKGRYVLRYSINNIFREHDFTYQILVLHRPVKY